MDFKLSVAQRLKSRGIKPLNMSGSWSRSPTHTVREAAREFFREVPFNQNEVSMEELQRVVNNMLDHTAAEQKRNIDQLCQLFGIRIDEIKGLDLAQKAESDPQTALLEHALNHFKSQDWKKFSVLSQVAFATLLVLQGTENSDFGHIDILCNLLRQICQSGHRRWLNCHLILEALAENSTQADKRVLLWKSASEFAGRATEHKADNSELVIYSTANLVWSIIDLVRVSLDTSCDTDDNPDTSSDADGNHLNRLHPSTAKLIKDSVALLWELSEDLEYEHWMTELLWSLNEILPPLDRPDSNRLVKLFQSFPQSSLPDYLHYRNGNSLYERPGPDSSLYGHFAFLRVEKNPNRLFSTVDRLVLFLVKVSEIPLNKVVLANLRLIGSSLEFLGVLLLAYVTRASANPCLSSKFEATMQSLENGVRTEYQEALRMTKEDCRQTRQSFAILTGPDRKK